MAAWAARRQSARPRSAGSSGSGRIGRGLSAARAKATSACSPSPGAGRPRSDRRRCARPAPPAPPAPSADPSTRRARAGVPQKALPLLIAPLGGHIAHDDDDALIASARRGDRRRLHRDPAIAPFARRSAGSGGCCSSPLGGAVRRAEFRRRERAPVLVPHAETPQELGGRGAQIGQAHRQRDRFVGVDQPAGPVAHGDPVGERAQHRLQLLARALERLQRRRLRLHPVQDQADSDGRWRS